MKFVFCYHRVIPKELVKKEYINRAMYVTPETFERHIRWMKRVGEIVGEDLLFKNMDGPSFIVTFDDGWKDNYTYAYPILRKYDAPAIIFISTKSIENQKLYWSEDVGIALKKSNKSEGEIENLLKTLTLSAIKLTNYGDLMNIDNNWNPGKSANLLDRFIEYMKVISVENREEILKMMYSSLGVSQYGSTDMLLTWDEIRDMQGQKVSFGSHTHTHPILDRMDDAGIDNELISSKNILEERLKRKISLFSYPNGCFGSNYIQFGLKKYGYEYAFTLERSPIFPDTDPFLIPRCLVYEEIAEALEAYWMKLVVRSLLVKGVNEARKLFRG